MTSDEARRASAESVTAWDANAAYWDERMGEGNDWHLTLVRPATMRLLDPRAGQRILDVGCGNGLFSRHLASLGVLVDAVDASQALLDRARAHESPHAGRIAYARVDCTDEAALLALGEARYDGAVANMVLMDVPEVTPLYRALARILRPGAPFVCSVQHPAFNHGGVVHVQETRDAGAGFETAHALKITGYLREETTYGAAIRGQPAPQPYFHRPISALLRPAFEAGLVLDALEEPAFPPGSDGRFGPLPDIPPVLVMRLRRPRSAS